MMNHNQNVTTRKFELQAFVDVINTADAYKLSRLSEYPSLFLSVSLYARESSFDSRRNIPLHGNRSYSRIRRRKVLWQGN